MAGIEQESLNGELRRRGIVVRLNSEGEPLVEADVLNAVNTDIRALAVRPEGGFYCLAGIENAQGTEAWTVYEAETDGDVSVINSGGRNTEDWSMDDMLVVENGDVVIAGTGYNGFGGPGAVIRFDRFGALVYQKGFDITGADRISVTDIINAGDGGQIISGTCNMPDNEFEIFLAKVNAAGDLVWSKRNKIADINLLQSENTALQLDGEGNILLIYDVVHSPLRSGAAILKFSASGELSDARIYEYGNLFSSFGDIILEPDGTLLLTLTANIRETLFLRLGPDLKVLESRLLETGNFMKAKRLLSRGPGMGYLLAGDGAGCEQESFLDLRLISLDSGLNFGPDACKSVETLVELRPVEVSVEDDGETTFISPRNLIIGAFEKVPIVRLEGSCNFIRTEVVDVVLPCNEEVLSLNFLIGGEAPIEDENFSDLTFELVDPNDLGALSLPDSFGVAPFVTGNGRELRYSKPGGLPTFGAEAIFSALTYTAIDASSLIGEHIIRIRTSGCGLTESKTFTFNVRAAPLVPVLSPGFDTLVCNQEDFTLSVADFENTEYQWSTGETTNQISISSDGFFEVTATNDCGADTTDFRVAFDQASLLVNFTVDLDFCEGEFISFTPDTTGATDFRWADGPLIAKRNFSVGGIYELQRRNACSEAITTVNVRELPRTPSVSAGFDTTLCTGAQIELNPEPSDVDSIFWSTGATTPSITVTEAGRYVAIVANSCGVDTVEYNLNENTEEPISDESEQLVLCFGDSVRFIPAATNSNNLVWEDGTTGSARVFSNPGRYVLKRTNGCFEAKTTVNVTVISCCEVYIPNAFSPNGDGVNDRFRVFTGNEGCVPLTDFELSVFDRWGGVVYVGDDRSGWDGTVQKGRPANPGAYVYVLAYFDGVQQVRRPGSVQLIR